MPSDCENENLAHLAQDEFNFRSRVGHVGVSGIIAGAANQRVGDAVVGDERVIAIAAEESVVAAAADEDIDSAASI